MVNTIDDYQAILDQLEAESQVQGQAQGGQPTNQPPQTPWNQAIAEQQYQNMLKQLYKSEKGETEMKVTPTVILPYNKYSKGAKSLASKLGYAKLGKPDVNALITGIISTNGNGDPYPKVETVINWGSTASFPANWNVRVLNKPNLVALCSDKLRFFNKVAGTVRIPEYTSSIDEAMAWVNDGIDVLGRKKKGSCGTDIVTFQEDPVKFTDSDFWVRYKKKKAEFRIHVFNGEIISEQQKKLRSSDSNGQPIDRGSVDFRIRNHKNGFIFARNEVSIPQDVRTQALAAVKAIGLDFGAVDVIYNAYESNAYVLEVNTAPGLEGTTLEDYTKSIGGYIATL